MLAARRVAPPSLEPKWLPISVSTWIRTYVRTHTYDDLTLVLVLALVPKDRNKDHADGHYRTGSIWVASRTERNGAVWALTHRVWAHDPHRRVTSTVTHTSVRSYMIMAVDVTITKTRVRVRTPMRVHVHVTQT